MDLTESIRKAISASGESRYAISKRSGLAESQLSRLVRGLNTPSLETVERIAEALDMEIILRPRRRSAKRKG
ncbi:MAG: XRE family transcriptional regulator [Phycisphaeraceae bacterium]|nr:MAG: XRE family transcriptional regulator [Phycisphaeraceae bacterium]